MVGSDDVIAKLRTREKKENENEKEEKNKEKGDKEPSQSLGGDLGLKIALRCKLPYLFMND